MLTEINGSMEESEEKGAAGFETTPLLSADSVETEFGRPLESIYRLAIKYYKENERSGKLQLDYDTRLRFMALAKHIKHGPFNEGLADCGWFDLVGNDARREWKRLSANGSGSGEVLTPRQAMWEFVRLLDAICPTTFRHDVKRRAALEAPPLPPPSAHLVRSAIKPSHIEESHIAKLTNSLQSANGQDVDSEEAKQVQLRYQQQKQQIQEALNQQTYHQFLAYAQQTHPGEPHKQEQLIRQLQDQHYEQYMSQVYSQQAQAQAASLASAAGPNQHSTNKQRSNGDGSRESSSDSEPRTPHDYMQQGLERPPSTGGGQLAAEMSGLKVRDDGDEEENGSDVSDEEQQDDGNPPNPLVAPANMWNSKSIVEFKATIKKEGPDGILKIGHGETVTVRVPTHEEGNSLYWEFATDHYDLGFGLYFEWTIAESNQVTVHVSESDEDEEEEELDESGGAAGLEAGGNAAQGSGNTPAVGDPEAGAAVGGSSRRSRDPSKPRVDEVIPIYRRDSQLEVFAGSHTYPGQGVYLLKFDNSYSLWRSKTLYYRVFYSK